MKKKALLIFAKEPVPGRVKTRLTPFLSAEAAARLYRCMLTDTITKATTFTGVQPFLFYAGGPDAQSFFNGVAEGMMVLPQEGMDLGQRLKNAFHAVFGAGYRTAVVIGTDAPHLPSAYVWRAFELLEGEQTEVVFGPSDDGGYYLLGLKQLHGELFINIPWSSEAVLAESLAVAERAGLTTALLPPWHDIDTAADLMRPELVDENNGAACTRAFLLSSEASTCHFNTSSL